MRSVITGTGIGVPPHIVTNEALSRLMDTSDEWIRVRSGIQERRYAETGQGSTDLGVIAARAAIAKAGLGMGDIDAVVFATMTPDHVLPGNGPLLQAALGLRTDLPTFDLRQQCSGFLYGLELADLLIQSGRYRRVLLVGAEVHTAFMPWHLGWNTLIGQSTREITEAERAENTLSRDRTVLFGDGAGAVVIEARDGEAGILKTRLFTDGTGAGVLTMTGASFKRRPFVTAEQIQAGETIPVMSGKEVFKSAVTLMPQAVREVCAEAGVAVEDLDLVLIHQANLRIIEGVQKALGLTPEKVPHNIERYGNTTAATLPILLHECLEDGRIQPGMLVAFTALGSGLHWGAALYRA
ncbi:3-oxoacyl-ACP synthase III family protein [Geothrix edaphica]|uniref:3-oxoacyl-[acyl-carrier-protein] synthase 3 n=1 Tax=Geothrix edaphica TaxID=2927976 RepID=A0ABQ5Q064_9BACT|nr:3-oxoacyl-[acyl-carrier-protein] synthase III C-terminal domain-containing protein [Geothrix edaphica]GLH68013.1 3-oxoacyl-[acyl-carrier-protein] synthase 3 [Geothrix edaphica]